MASSDKQSGGGCLAAFIAIAIVGVVVVFLLSAVGHALGLTPTYSELTDRPDGWLDRHYRGVLGGYVLTVLLIAAAAALVIFALLTQHEDANRARNAHEWLRRTVVLSAAVVVVAVAAPVGALDNPRGNVPRLVGMSAAKADEKLSDAGLSASFKEVASDEDRCRVTWQKPKPGGEVDQYGEVKLRCKIKVPDVVGEKANPAQTRISNAGLEDTLVDEPRDYDLTRCRVASQSKHGLATPNSTVRLRLKCTHPAPIPASQTPPPPQPQPTQSACDPNYKGACLGPNASDYDCAGGQGNGPEYVQGPITVVGTDHYGLNRDPDSTACEPYAP